MGGDGRGGGGLGGGGLGGGGLGGGGLGGDGWAVAQFSTQTLVVAATGVTSDIVPYVPAQLSLLAACALGMPCETKLPLLRAELKAAAVALGPPA